MQLNTSSIIIFVVEETLIRFGRHTMRRSAWAAMMLSRLVRGPVPNVEETCEEATTPRANHVAPDVSVEEIVRGAFRKFGGNPSDRVGRDANTNGGVEACAKFVGSRDNAKEGGDDADGGIDATSISGGILTLNHEDNADEEEGADNLVGEYSNVHGKVIHICTIVRHASDGVCRSKHCDVGIGDSEGTQPGESHSGKTTKELR